jgi:hypothetical protein
MKRMICAVSIAALLLVPMAAMAGTTLYGNARISLNYSDNDDGADSNFSAQDNVSRLGVKGEYGDAIKGFFHLQVSARVAPDSNVTVGVPAIDELGNPATISASGKDNDAFGQRFYFAGLKGSFGALSYGRVTNAYKMPGYKMNGKLYDTTTNNVNGTIGTGGASYGLSPMNNGFTPTVVQYVTPSLGGAKLNGTVAIDGSSNNDHGYVVGASYGAGGIDVGVVFADNGNGNQLPNLAAEGDAYRVYGSYKTDKMMLGLSYEGVDIIGDLTDDKVNYIFAIGSMKMSPKAELLASIGVVDAGMAEGVGGTIGVNYGIVENTEILLSGSYADLERDAAPVAVSLLFVHNFSISSN